MKEKWAKILIVSMLLSLSTPVYASSLNMLSEESLNVFGHDKILNVVIKNGERGQ